MGHCKDGSLPGHREHEGTILIPSYTQWSFQFQFSSKGKVPATRWGRREAGICIYSSQFCSLCARQPACNKPKRKYNWTPWTSSEIKNSSYVSKVLEHKTLDGSCSFWSVDDQAIHASSVADDLWPSGTLLQFLPSHSQEVKFCLASPGLFRVLHWLADEIVLAVTPCRLLIWTLISWWHMVPSCLPKGRCEARKGGCTPSRKTFCETNNWKISVQQKQAYHSEKPKAQTCSKKQACVCFLKSVVVLIIWKAWLTKQN